jgi:sialate O-acetylesterase
MTNRLPFVLTFSWFVLCNALCGFSEVRVPHIFDDDMVLQRDKPVRVWGWAGKSERVTVEFARQSKSAVTDGTGQWLVDLEPMVANGTAQTLIVKGSDNSVAFENVLVGDVWVLGGQSNMEAALQNIKDGELEILSANLPLIRLMTIPLQASPTPVTDFPRLDEYNSWSRVTERKGDWQVCTPESVKLFSAVGFVCGRRIQRVTGIPIGLIDTSWGGTTVEAWQSRKTLESIPEAAALLKSWDAQVSAYDPQASLVDVIKRWESQAARLKKEGKAVPPKPTEPKPSPAVNRNNPGAAYNGIIAPIAGLSVKGAIFYQGINNAVGGARPSLYAKTFTNLIPAWRRTFRDEKLPFGICQMVSWGFPPEVKDTEINMVSSAPYIRESQLTAHRAHPDTGFVVAYDLGHIQMHSPYKTALGERIARWALATQYGKNVTYRTPLYQGQRVEQDKIVVTFDQPIHPTFGGRAKIEGFAIAAEDGHFYPAEAKMTQSNEVTVSSPFVKSPLNVRYAWSTHPKATLVGAGSNGLPAAPFRTDSQQWRDAPFGQRGSLEDKEYREWFTEQRRLATEQAEHRLRLEAESVLKDSASDKK